MWVAEITHSRAYSGVCLFACGVEIRLAPCNCVYKREVVREKTNKIYLMFYLLVFRTLENKLRRERTHTKE